jgi:hypothetical protein
MQTTFLAEVTEDQREVVSEWHYALLRALTTKEHLTRSLEAEVGRVDPNRFRDASTRAYEKQQQRMVAPAKSLPPVGRREKCFDFRRSQEVDHALHRALRTDGEHPLGEPYRSRITECHVPEKGVDYGQAGIPRTRAVAPLAFQEVEEGEYEIAIQVLDVEAIGRLAESLAAEEHE